MALKEGRCTNCGSILMLDPTQEKGHCLYCDAVFEAAEAFALYEDATGYVFPNEEQPEYTGPNLDPVQYKARFDESEFAKKVEQAKKLSQQRKEAAAAEPKLNLSNEAVPELTLSTKNKLMIIGAFVVVFALFFAIMIPRSIERDRVRKDLQENFLAKLSEDHEVDEDNLLIRENNNSEAVLHLKESPAKEDASKIFELFCQERADLLSENEDEQIYKKVKMQIISSDGGWLIEGNTDSSEESYKISERE